MPESTPNLPPPVLTNLPHLNPYGEMPPLSQKNWEFATAALAEFEGLDPEHELHKITVEAMASCLDEVDRLYGANVDDVGEAYRANPFANRSLPAFYHNGLRTHVAIADTVFYMKWANEQAELAGQPQPYESAGVIYGTLLAAAFDDIIFTGERDVGEDASRAVAREYLTAVGAPPELIDAVDIAIDASRFNETTGQQKFDKTKGAVEEQRGSLVGDLFGLGGPEGPANAFMLAIENLHKEGPPINPKPKPGEPIERVLYDLARAQNWQGENILDFFDFIQANPIAKQKFGKFLETNRDFIVDWHRYPDDRVNTLLAAGKEQSAAIQTELGIAIQENRLTIREAFRCALMYAQARTGWEDQPSLLPSKPTTQHDIARIVLTRSTIEELKNPVPGKAFFDRYMAELGR